MVLLADLASNETQLLTEVATVAKVHLRDFQDIADCLVRVFLLFLLQFVSFNFAAGLFAAFIFAFHVPIRCFAFHLFRFFENLLFLGVYHQVTLGTA